MGLLLLLPSRTVSEALGQSQQRSVEAWETVRSATENQYVANYKYTTENINSVTSEFCTIMCFKLLIEVQ